MILDLDRLLELHAATTKGPWRTGRSVHRTVYGQDDAPGPLCLMGRAEDAAFTVAAHEAVPVLIARIRELEQKLDNVNKLYDWLSDKQKNWGQP